MKAQEIKAKFWSKVVCSCSFGHGIEVSDDAAIGKMPRAQASPNFMAPSLGRAGQAPLRPQTQAAVLD